MNVNGIEMNMTTYRILDLYGLYVGDYNNIQEIQVAINKEIDIRQDKKIQETKALIGL